MADCKFKVIPGGKSHVSQPQVLRTGVNVSNNRYVPLGSIITTQATADRLPFISKSSYLKASTKQQYKPMPNWSVAS